MDLRYREEIFNKINLLCIVAPIHNSLANLQVGVIGLDKFSLNTHLTALFSDCFIQLGGPTCYNQVCTLTGKQKGGGFTNYGGGTCQNGNLSGYFRKPHMFLLFKDQMILSGCIQVSINTPVLWGQQACHLVHNLVSYLLAQFAADRIVGGFQVKRLAHYKS